MAHHGYPKNYILTFLAGKTAGTYVHVYVHQIRRCVSCSNGLQIQEKFYDLFYCHFGSRNDIIYVGTVHSKIYRRIWEYLRENYYEKQFGKFLFQIFNAISILITKNVNIN